MNRSTWEYRLEGFVGRMIDWLGDDPRRRAVGPPPPVSSAPVSSAPAASAPAASAPVTSEPVASEPATKPIENLDDSLAARVLRLLAEADDGAAMRELSEATGATRHQLRAVLKELTDAGRIRRLGAGLTTRYERID